MARVIGRSIGISTRHAIEISNFMRGKNVQKMKAFLEDVIKMKRAVPFTRFNKGVGHKPGMGPGRYPIKSCTEILALLKSAEANAQFKALNTSNLVISHINADKASMAWHYGRQRRRRMKRTNMEIILTERGSLKEKKNIKEVKKTDEKKIKTEVKPKEKKAAEEPSKKEDIKKTEKVEEKVKAQEKAPVKKEIKKDTQNQEKKENARTAKQEDAKK